MSAIQTSPLRSTAPRRLIAGGGAGGGERDFEEPRIHTKARTGSGAPHELVIAHTAKTNL